MTEKGTFERAFHTLVQKCGKVQHYVNMLSTIAVLTCFSHSNSRVLHLDTDCIIIKPTEQLPVLREEVSEETMPAAMNKAQPNTKQLQQDPFYKHSCWYFSAKFDTRLISTVRHSRKGYKQPSRTQGLGYPERNSPNVRNVALFICSDL